MTKMVMLLFFSGFLCLVLSPPVFGLQTCGGDLGLGTGAIKNSQLSASKLSEGSDLDDVRYNCCGDTEDGGLCLDAPDPTSKPFLDIRFHNFTAISAITLQAPLNNRSYVRWYRVQYVPYKRTDLQEVMDGEDARDFRGIKTASDDEFKSVLSPRIITQHLRLVFDDASNRACFRLEIFGCQSSALCTSPCQNGGVCVGVEQCQCAAGFSGPLCQRAQSVINPKACKDPLGMATGGINSSQLSAKTTAKNSSLEFARVDCCQDRQDGAWCPDPDTKSIGQWFQVQFAQPMGITEIRIQKPTEGTGPDKFLKTYSIQYIPEAEVQTGVRGGMEDYTKDGNKVIFNAFDKTEPMTSQLDVPIYTRALRLVVESYEGQPCFRFELYGCNPNVVEEDDGPKIELTKELQTGHFIFVLMGTPVPQFVPIGNQSEDALDLFRDQYILIQERQPSEIRPCPLNLADCDQGMTVHLRLRFRDIYDNTFLFSNGGYSSDTNGLTILYRFDSLHVYVRIANKFWFVSYRPDKRRELVNVWSELYTSWHADRGLTLYFNDVLVAESGAFQQVVQTVELVPSVCFVGGLPTLKSPYVIALLDKLRIWTVHIWVLIEDRTLIFDDEKPTPGTCPAGCVKEGSTIAGYPIMQGSPTLTARIDPSSGAFEFVCSLPSVAEKNVEYQVSWLSGGKVVASSIIKDNRKEARLQLNHETLRRQIKSTMMCAVRARFTGGCGGSLGAEKRSYYFTARIELITTAITIVEGGGSEKVEISTNAPPSMLCEEGEYTLSVQLDKHRRELRDRRRRVISQAVVAQPDGVASSELNVTDNNWSEVHAFLVKAVLDGRRDRDQVRDLSVFVTCGDGKRILLGVVKLTIRDSDKAGSCAWWNDPHIRTFNGRSYDNFYAGEFVFYRHKEQPYQINTILAKCSPRSRATCNCAVAIRTQDDVIIFDKCARQGGRERQSQVPLYIYFLINGELTKGTQLRRLGSGRQHVVTLPHGGEVSLRISQHFLNVEYKPAPTDFEQTEGLCGTFDGSRANDLMLRDGSIVTKYRGRLPNVFSADWRAKDGEKLFAGTEPVVDRKVIHDNYCRVLEGEKTDCGPGYDRIDSASAAQGKDVTMMYMRDFSYKAKPKPRPGPDPSRGDGFVRRKRSTDNAGLDPFAPFDVDTNHKPGDSAWPTLSNRTEQDARDYCNQTINGDSAVQKCGPFMARTFEAEVEACVQDIGATDELHWADETVATIVRECRTLLDSQDNAAEDDGQPATLPGGLTEEQLEESLCPKNCTGNGDCKEGVCVCDQGAVGDDCSQKLTDPPLVNYVHDDGLCDLNGKQCADAVIFGDNFYDTSSLTCHMQPYKLGSPLPAADSDVTKVSAVYTKFDQIACPVAEKRAYLVRVSNDAQRPADDRLLFVAYDSVCQECSVGGSIEEARCTRVPNSCIIDGGCFAKGETNPGQACKVCDPRIADDKWSQSYIGDCRYMSRTLNTTDITIVVLVTVVVLSVLVFTIAYICYRKWTAKESDPGPEGPPVVHKSTRYLRKSGEFNDAFVADDFDSHNL